MYSFGLCESFVSSAAIEDPFCKIILQIIKKYLILHFILLIFNVFRPRTGFDKSSLERLEQLFRKTVGNEKEIRREDFKKIVTSKNVRCDWFLSGFETIFKWIFPLIRYYSTLCQQPFFTNRVFQIFDKDNSGSISLQEFIDAIHQFAGQSPEDKIKFLFKVYDIDGKWNKKKTEVK